MTSNEHQAPDPEPQRSGVQAHGSTRARADTKALFQVGRHRPVYLWGGPGTVRMNRLKFMNAPVDEEVHAECHTEVGAARMAEEAYLNWAYLMYDWGFPPEVEQEDWDDFCRAVRVYQSAGVKTFGYIQSSNCAFDGSYRDKGWYALDPKGRPFYYYTGRYMTCPTNPDWLEHLRQMVRGVVEAGSDGVFFDNPWHGIQPIHFGRVWMGQAGCYCDRCRATFRQDTGLEIPENLVPEGDGPSRRYLAWRAGQVTGYLTMLSEYARSLNPNVVISVNDYDAVMRPSYLVHGIDLHALAKVQDVMMIENFGLPKWEDGSRGEAPLLANNALTIRTARVLIGDTPLSVDPYDKGIGFDAVYPPRRFRQAIAEAAACGVPMVVKGTEYNQDGTFTLLTAEPFGPQRKAIGQIHRWLEAHADLYLDRENLARIGLLFPGHALWQDWDRQAGPYLGVGQTLLAAGVPWRVVDHGADLADLDVLYCFDGPPSPDALPPGLRLVSVPDLAGWEPASPPFLARHLSLRKIVTGVVSWFYQSYFRWRWARQVGDSLGLTQIFIQSPHFRLPPAGAREALLETLDKAPFPQVTAKAPVLVETWQKGDLWQLHLVNYAAKPQDVQVVFEEMVSGRILSPDTHAESREPGSETSFQGAELNLALDVYAVLEYQA